MAIGPPSPYELDPTRKSFASSLQQPARRFGLSLPTDAYQENQGRPLPPLVRNLVAVFSVPGSLPHGTVSAITQWDSS